MISGFTGTNPVLVGHSYFLRRDKKEWEARKPYPPLGTLYAAGALRRDGHPIALYDAMLEPDPAGFVNRLQAVRPWLVVLYEDNFNYVTKMCLLRHREATLTMVRAAREAGCQVVCSGSDVADHSRDYLQAGAHFVLKGEGEQTLSELVASLSGRSAVAPTSIPGLVLLDRDGNPVRTQPRAPLRQLDALPPPAWDLVDMERYRSVWQKHHGYFSLNISTTRGCPYRCNWCAKPVYGDLYTSRSPASVVVEMCSLSRNYRPDHLWITDDIFGLKPGWIREFADCAQQQELAIPFRCLSRVDLLTPDAVHDLKRAGCQCVWVGAESGSQRVLDAMDKGTRVEQIRRAARLLRDAGIQVGFFLQFGYPGEEMEDIRATRRLVRECRPDDIGISVSYPLPGTRFHERVRSQLGSAHNWSDSADLALLYRGRYPPDFYRALHRQVHAEFRIGKAWQLLRSRSREAWPILDLPRQVGRWALAAFQVASLQRTPPSTATGRQPWT